VTVFAIGIRTFNQTSVAFVVNAREKPAKTASNLTLNGSYDGRVRL
jgi:hypothetical protein